MDFRRPGFRRSTRRHFLTVAAGGVAIAMSTPAHAVDPSEEAWNFLAARATAMTIQLKRQTEKIATALTSVSGDAAFVSVFGMGIANPAERKRRTLAAAEELGQIAVKERTEFLPLIDAYLAAPSDASWQPVKTSMFGVLERLYVLQTKLDRLSGIDPTANAANEMVDGKAQLLEDRARAGRPTSAAGIEAFRGFRSVFGSLVVRKAELAAQLARLGAAM